jgi:hypothetical protein
MTVKCRTSASSVIHAKNLRAAQSLAIRCTACSAMRKRDFLTASVTGGLTWLSYPDSASCKPPVVIETESSPGERQLSLTATGQDSKLLLSIAQPHGHIMILRQLYLTSCQIVIYPISM